MPVFARTGRIIEDNWHHWQPDNTQLPAGNLLVHARDWPSHRDDLLQQHHALGLIISEDEEFFSSEADLGRFNLICIHFTSFTNGQGFSIATLLRERYGFRGELRATGEIIFDQLFYLKRCGFDSFELNHDIDSLTLIQTLNSFSDCYQQACDQPLPLFRWRR